MVATNAEYPIINHLDAANPKIELGWKWHFKAGSGHNHALPLVVAKCPWIRGCNSPYKVMNLFGRLIPMNLPIRRLSAAKIAAFLELIRPAGNNSLQ